MLVFAAADVNYFIQHGLEFVNSCVANENFCHVVIFPNFEEDLDVQEKKLLHFMNNKFNKYKHPNTKFYCLEPLWFPYKYDLEIENTKAYYASFRFLYLKEVFASHPEIDSVIVLDIDSIITKKLPKIEEDVGLYLRLGNTVGSSQYEIEGMKVAAGIVYVSRNGLDFSLDLYNEIVKNPIRWFNDQHALYNAFKNTSLSVKDFSCEKWMDWEFNDMDYMIHTGKGDRKNNPKYLAIKEKYFEFKHLDTDIHRDSV